jgi:hypothetical protein
MMNIELTIWHSGQNWCAENELLSVAAPTLEELDQQVESLLKDNKIHKKGSKTRVLMLFDNSTIPQWIRQYAQHYFNRILEIEG